MQVMSRRMNFSLGGFVRADCWESSVNDLRRWLSSVRGGIERGFSRRKKILDPHGPFLQKWNCILAISCMFAILVDTLFFYIPVIDGKKECLSLDSRLTVVAFVLRSLADTFYVLHILFRFRTGFRDPAAVYGRGVLIVDSYAIAKRYLSSYFIIDVLSVLPIPQMATLVILPKRKGPIPPITKDWLTYVVCLQIWPRLLRTYPLYKEVAITSGIFIDETAWGRAVGGAALNLFLYLLASHGIGAFWYFFAIERRGSCLRAACERLKCAFDFSYCGEQHEGNYTTLNHFCPLLESNEIKNATDFYFGIFLNALRSGVVETRNVPKKILYCFWWGVRSVSSFGQNLETSTYEWENLFAVFISVVGLVVFTFLIGNMQKYLQSITMQHLPNANRPDIKRRCLALLKRVPTFDKMDELLLDEVYNRLKPVLYKANSFVVHEGDPVREMIFFLKDPLLTMTTNGGRTADYPNGGDFFCGAELLRWASEGPNSPLPTSTRTVQIVADNEAFALMADDLKFVVSQFQQLHGRELNLFVE